MRKLTELLDLMTTGAWRELDEKALAALVDDINALNLAAYNAEEAVRYAGKYPALSDGSLRRLADLVGYVRRAHPGLHAIRLLDVGAGHGIRARHFYELGFEVTLVEPCRFFSAKCRELEARGKLPKGATHQADMRALPFGDGVFDVVYMNGVLHHEPFLPGTSLGQARAMVEAARVLDEGGHLFVSTTHGETPFSVRGQRFFQPSTETALRELAEAAGLGVVQVSTRHGNGPLGEESPWIEGLFVKGAGRVA